ncbi:erythromycin esterase family protein [Novosphingobium mangrovi (ex Hu et al. 2023)]|uniref:Erythromycin esterase family protein n=1 Tax=Novosphingobium mangrovi (ex Hu et al. 2023) TaxID=2930094 RepID=A0ABT0ACT6_9SPHN|nr:erythromycin esterase family protein [Novosphingobium mangrovi (ex Hu et al. 2023)]MCJ1960986.1 erythromycin esterase family protein [Novosphingobium mangrovi (ex Hu et al. 2023)]
MRPGPRRLAALALTPVWGLAFCMAACATPASQSDDEAFRDYAQMHVRPLPATGDLLAGLQDENAPGAVTDRLCAAKIVALGEPEHGAPGPLRVRDRLFRSLIARCGTRVIVLETGFTEAAILNQWLQTGSGDIDDVLRRGLTWGFDRYPQNRALLLWMREYNEAHPHDPLHLYGMDIPGGDKEDGLGATRVVLDTIGAFIASQSPEGLEREVEVLEDLAPHFTLTAWRSVPAPRRAALKPALDKIAARLHGSDHLPVLTREWMLQNIEVARSSAAMFASWPQASSNHPGIPPEAWQSAQIRDATMAANVMWVQQHIHRRGPVFVTAHTAHTMAAKVQGSIWDSYATPPAAMGDNLRTRLGRQYVTITISRTAGDAGSLDRALSKARRGGFLLSLTAPNATDAARRWMESPQSIHVNAKDSLRISPAQAFDMLIHLP